MSEARTCPQCGAPLPANAADWLCPRCLLGQAAGATSVINAANDAPPPGPGDILPATSILHYFGDYELLHEIARGGMGVVYKARQVSLNRIVAVKMLQSGRLAGEEFKRRFRVEAEAAASLQHPDIVAIHEVGEHEGQQYFSMDYVEGSDLAALVREKPLPARRAAEYVKTIAEAIHYAHQRGILHRDLKPSNVLIDANGQPHVTDFGLAKFVVPLSDSSATAEPAKAGTTNANDLTLTGQVLGTPGFMSPEQAGGKRGNVGTTSDVYSLGALLYFLVTARPPFAADSLEETLRQVHEAEPVSPRLLNPAVPRDLETICLKCLNKEQSRRYVTAQDLADELGRFLADEPIQARPASAPEKLWRWCQRQPVLAAVIFGFLLVGAIGLTGISWQWRRAERNAKVATGNLRESYLAQAQALRLSSKAGRRTEALEAIAKAAALEPSLELRNEAIASLAQTDVRIACKYAVPLWPDNELFDPAFELSATWLSHTRIRVQHVHSREPVLEFDVPRGRLSMLRRFSPNQRYLAFATYADQTWVQDLVKNSVVLHGLPEGAIGDFSPDSQTFAIGNLRGTVSVFDLSTGERLRELGPSIPDHGVAFDPSGKKLACWNSVRIEIRDAMTGQEVHHLRSGSALSSRRPNIVQNYVRAAWSGDGRLLAVVEADRRINLWGMDDGQLVRAFLGHSSDIVCVALSPDGRFVASSAFDRSIRLWEVMTGRMLTALPGDVWQVGFSANSRLIGPSPQGNGTNAVFEMVEPKWFYRLAPPGSVVESHAVHALDFSPDGRLVSTASSDGIGIWDRFAQRFLASIPAREACAALFNPESNALFVSAAGALSWWPMHFEEDHGTNVLTIGPPQPVGLTAGSWAFPVIKPRSGRMAVASTERRAAIAELRAPTNWVRLEKIHGGSHYIDLSPDGRLAATGTWNGRGVRIWHAQSGKLLHEYSVNHHAAVAFSPDGRWLIVSERECRALEVGTWTNAAVIRPHTPEVHLATIAFSPDGRLLARAKSPTSFELIEPGTWRSVAVLQSPYPIGLCWPKFSPDGTLLAAADISLGVQVWDLRALRAELRPMGLDWDHPAYPAGTPTPEIRPITVQVLTK